MTAKVLDDTHMFGLNFYLVAGRQKRVETDDELRVAAEERRNTGNNTRCVNTAMEHDTDTQLRWC